MDIQKKRKGVAALLAATLLWATTFVMMKSAMEEVPTLWVIALRFAGAAVMLAAVAGKRLKSWTKALSSAVRKWACSYFWPIGCKISA